MTVTDRTSIRIRKNKSPLSDPENEQIDADRVLERFDVRNSGFNINDNWNKNQKDENLSNIYGKSSSTGREDRFFPLNLRCDPQHVLDGMVVLKCLFCERYKTPIQNDMRIHLRYTHQLQLLKDLPLRGKGFNMAYRVGFVMDIMKQKTPREYYDHNTAIFPPEELN
jgi:hypothetical protein